MSWDIFVQDFGSYARLEDIPSDFQPEPIGSLDEVRAKVERVCPGITFDNTGWGVMTGDGWSFELNSLSKDPCRGFALHVRGDDGSIPVIACLLQELGVRGVDSGSGTFFEDAVASDQFAKWRDYRDQVVGPV